MATTVRVEAAVAGRKHADTAERPLDIEVAEGRIAVRDLLDAVARAEVAAFETRAAESTFLRLLTEESLAADLAQGAVRTGGRSATGSEGGKAGGDSALDPDADFVPNTDVDVEAAVATVLEAFGDGQFAMLVGDDKVDDLDTVVDLRADTRLLFIRLVPLTGRS